MSLRFVSAEDSGSAPAEAGGARGDTAEVVTFQVCNNGFRPIRRVQFEPYTSRVGDTTRHEVVLHAGPADDSAGSRLSADTVLQQAGCAVLSWRGRFLVMDSVGADLRVVEEAIR